MISAVALVTFILFASTVLHARRATAPHGDLIHQLIIEIESVTEDELFVRMEVTVDYCELTARASTTNFRVEDATSRFSETLVASVQTRVPAIRLCDIFERTDALTASLTSELACVADSVGFTIRALAITDIAPRMSKGALPNRACVATVRYERSAAPAAAPAAP